MKYLFLNLVLFVLVLGSIGGSETGAATTAPSLSLAQKITLTTDVEGGSARPEIIATADRVFVLYLGHINNPRTFDVKIYNADLDTLIASKTIVSGNATYGYPTDIRVTSEGAYLYAFYETASVDKTFLWGAKYALNDTFDLVASTTTPIAISKPEPVLVNGEELLNDPAPMVGTNEVFVVTRLKDSLTMAGNTIYHVLGFNKTDFSKGSDFILDLSSVANGRGRVASLLNWNGNILMALATTISDQGIQEGLDDSAASDIVLVRMNQDWTFNPLTDVRTISADETNDRENYITGLETDGTHFYLTCHSL